ncbi:MAG: SlyX family protein [Verrucomicrobia bacterium]|nr:SlyX family protein [Verrucomicrobiota bacterium]
MCRILKLVTLASTGILVWAASGQQVQDQSAVIADLQKQVKTLQEQMERMKEGPPRDVEAEELMKKKLFDSKGLSLGFYGEAKYRFPQSGANRFDPHRFVLTPSYQINDWLVFNSEIEFEHGGIDESSAAHSRFDGEIEIEQFYVDILLHEHFNVRSLGIDLVPVGRINKYHEPSLFYSTERPELYTEIIPSTWMEPSFGFFGKITDDLDYQVMVSTGLEDYAGSTTAPGINAAGGVRAARPRLRRADENNLAYSARLTYRGIPGLDASTSAYVTEVRGAAKEKSLLALWDIEALYRVPKTGLELRADFAYWHVDDPKHLLANNNASATDNVGDRLYGWYAEAAYHFWPNAWRGGRGRDMDLVPFVRYSEIVTQSGLSAGGTELDDGATNKEFLTIGLAYFLNSNFVLKADWRRNLNGSAATEGSAANQDYFQIGAGVFF